MSKILLIALTCFALSSCGLFRKSKRSEKSSEKVESTRNAQVKTDMTVVESGRINVNERSVTTFNGKTKIYPPKGSQVTIAPDGTITAEADSITQDTKRHTDAARDIAGEATKKLQHKKDSVEQEGQNQQIEQHKKESESKPSFFATWGMWIGIGMAVAIVIISIILYMRR
ncbi:MULTISPECIES: hypothetical protein [Sphingobacterium]|uniref:Lipoprotein n=1 Tax=Sphingobacterium populi TaxID=1812824 RepID=A0ABW5U932_9SPHI|nr:hypothetical protein [Sphingobacterium sp. CFCC 11742]